LFAQRLTAPPFDNYDSKRNNIFIVTLFARKGQTSSQCWVHFNILALGFLGGRAEARPYQRRRAYSV
jgi:hypothetical protein